MPGQYLTALLLSLTQPISSGQFRLLNVFMNRVSTNYYQQVARSFFKIEEEVRTLLVNSSYYEFKGYKWPSMAAYQNKRNGHTRFTVEEILSILEATPELQDRLPLAHNYDRLRRRLGDDLLATQIHLKLLFAKSPKQLAIITAWKGPSVISYNQFILRFKDPALWSASEIEAVAIRLGEYMQALTNLVNPIDEQILEIAPDIHEQNLARYVKDKKKSMPKH